MFYAKICYKKNHRMNYSCISAWFSVTLDVLKALKFSALAANYQNISRTPKSWNALVFIPFPTLISFFKVVFFPQVAQARYESPWATVTPKTLYG